uniref:Uncharacterized protein n=1 Tax=Tanacetum cinerariifolium TaxID=118510 RepID=A0A6L2MB37_TANCI|nr:hypothetical protein [Tanacetum cinerariifolium]
MEYNEKKSTMKGFATDDQADYYTGITSITVNGKNAYELKGKFLEDLHNNSFSGTNGEDADSKLKEETLRNKAIMEGSIDEDVESNSKGWKSLDDFKSTKDDRNEWEYENEHEDDERYELCGNETHELPVCNIKRFEMIKYSFEQDEEYVSIKENEYEDLTSTSEDACRAYQEILRMMDEGWMVTRME